MPGRRIEIYIAGNDPNLDPSSNSSLFTLHSSLLPHLLRGNAVEDLFMLSQCDYLIGPPSTYSLVAAMYRDIPLYRIDSPDAQLMTLDAFHPFDYWFRRIL
jgi:hypothetical protein